MHSKAIKTFLTILFGSMALFMIYLVIVTSIQSDLFNLPSVVLNEPWFKTTLVDFYFLVSILSAWVIYKEKCPGIRICWIVAFICLGSIAACGYVFLQLATLKENEEIEHVLLRKDHS